MKCWAIILFFLSSLPLPAQDSTETRKKWELNGYIKNLESLSFDAHFRNSTSMNLLHNRINLKWQPSAKITGSAEIRNRLFWGEEVKLNPGLAGQLRNSNEYTDLQKIWLRDPGVVLHTNIERLHLAYRDSNWSLRAGRQRINWGITTTWNPNDLFNTYNFLDFDYEERPGVDAVRFNYIINNASGIELAYAQLGKKQGSVAALKYNLNKGGYDLQLNTGWYREHFTFGVGWAGNIKEAGFKGELQYFVKNKDSASHLNLTMEWDYMFKNGWYMSAGILLNNKGLYRPVSQWNQIDLTLSPENLMPTKWNLIMGAARQITPLFSIRNNVLFAPGSNIVILLPSLSYNLAGNLDADLIWQSFFAEMEDRFQGVSHRGFLRMKWSF